MAIRTSNVYRSVSRTCCFHNGILTMKFVDAHNRSSCDAYRCEEIPSNVGRSFRVTKIIEASKAIADGKTYTVDMDGQGWSACGCESNIRRNTCRHVEALRALLNSQKIPGGIPGANEDGNSQ